MEYSMGRQKASYFQPRRSGDRRQKGTMKIGDTQLGGGTQDRIVLLYEDAAKLASAWQKALRHAEREAGRLMREEREKRGISLREFAKRLGVSPPHLSDMENGNRRYSTAWVAEAFAVFEQNPGGQIAANTKGTVE